MKRTLYIENIPPKLSVEVLREWLETYGTVSRIELTDHVPLAGGRSGYV